MHLKTSFGLTVKKVKIKRVFELFFQKSTLSCLTCAKQEHTSFKFVCKLVITINHNVYLLLKSEVPLLIFIVF